MDEMNYVQHSVAEQVAGEFLDEIEKLQKENKSLRKALEFYADENNWNQKYRSPFNSEYYDSEASLDEGEKARQSLNKR